MSDLDIKRVVEAVLFAADSPVSLDKLVEIVGDAKRSDVRSAIDELNDEYDREGHCFSAVEIASGWQLYVRPEYSTWVKELHKGRMPTRLSQAALETLAIVAYKQPIVRAEVEIIRGVDSSGVLSTLLRRGLIAIAGRAPGMGRALMYSTTREFLRYFGLNAVTDLPRLEEFAEVLGLKPDELELAVEGAESMAGVAAGDASLSASDASGEPLPDTMRGAVAPEEHVLERTAPVQHTGTTTEAGGDGGDTERDHVPLTSTSVPNLEPGDNRHTVNDRDIIDPLDEA